MTTDFTPGPPYVVDVPPDFFVAQIDLTARRAEKRALLDALSAAFQFPTGPSPNWDALEDSLRDLSWLSAKGFLVVLQIGDADEHDLATLCEIFRTNGELFANEGIPYKLILARSR